MTPFPKLFDSYVKLTREQFITIANGDNVPICRSRNITLESSIVLKDVLYVPQLINSLISIQKLRKDFNCSITLMFL